MQQRLNKAQISAAEWEIQFNPRAATPDSEAYRAMLAPYNAAAVAELRCHSDVSFGDHPLRNLDIFPAASANAPVHVFIHIIVFSVSIYPYSRVTRALIIN